HVTDVSCGCCDAALQINAFFNAMNAPTSLAGLPSSTVKRKEIRFVDLFCRGGGTSSAIIEVAEAFKMYCRLTGYNTGRKPLLPTKRIILAQKPFARICTISNPHRYFKEFELDGLWA